MPPAARWELVSYPEGRGGATCARLTPRGLEVRTPHRAPSAPPAKSSQSPSPSQGPHLTSPPPYPSPQLAELDARVRALDHLHQLAALAATGAGDGECPAPRTRKPDRPGNRDAASQRASDAERLVATAADLCARADELAALDAASLAWDGVADAARSDASDHAATERCATRLREVSASLSAIAAATTTTTDADTTNAAMDPRRACAALAASLASRLAALGSDRTEHASRARAVAEEALGTAGDWIHLERAVGSVRSPERSSAETREEFFDSKLARSSTPHSRRLGKGEGGEGCAESARPIGCEVLMANASWFARAYGAWAASHANMGRELRDGKPASVPLARDGEDGTSSGDGGGRIGGIRASPWSESAAAAIDSVAAAAATLGAPIPHDSRPSPLGTDALFLLAELLDRTSGVVANWVTHQPRLWPGSRTATNLCVVASDAALVHDALTRAASVFERVAREEDDEDDDGAVSGASGASGVQQSGLINRVCGPQSNDRIAPGSERVLHSVSISARRTRLALGGAIDAASNAVAKSLDDAWASAPKGTWGGKGAGSKSTKEDPASTSPAVDAVRKQILAPLRKALASLDPRVSAVIGPRAAAAATQGYLARLLAEGPRGVRAKRGGVTLVELDVEATIEAAGEPAIEASSAGSGAMSAMSAWRSAARRARAVVMLAKGGDGAGLPGEEVEAWRKVFA